MDKEIIEIAKSIKALQKVAVQNTLLICKPKVENIINSNCKDENFIEHTLDALCEVAFDNDVLILFKKLCRYYYRINPVATAEQIQFYRDMWDSDEE